jgi:hypothetical protein
VLIGVDGKGSIEQIKKELNQNFPNNEFPIFEIHGEIDIAEIDYAFNYKEAAVYIATPILQSGVTLEGLTHGHFIGLGKRMENQNGYNTLCSYELSQEEMNQWFGRLGRTQDGVVFVQKTSQGWEDTFKKRTKNKTAESCLINPAELIIDFAKHNLDLRNAVVLNRPSVNNLAIAFNVLNLLGLVDTDGVLTPEGVMVGNHQRNFREAIILEVTKVFGLQLTGQKLVSLIREGCPFAFMSVSDKKQLCQEFKVPKNLFFSEHLVSIFIIDKLTQEFNGVPKGGDKLLFDIYYQKYGEMVGDFRRSSFFLKALFKLMNTFKELNETEVDDSPDNLVIGVQAALYKAYFDQLALDYKLKTYSVENGKLKSEKQFIQRSKKGYFSEMDKYSVAASEKGIPFAAVGNVVAIETRYEPRYIMDLFTDCSHAHSVLSKSKK